MEARWNDLSKVEAALKRYDDEEPRLFEKHCGPEVTDEMFAAYTAACSKLIDAVRRAFYHATYDVNKHSHAAMATTDIAFLRSCVAAWRKEKDDA